MGTNLYKKEGEELYTVDLTSMKDSHKTTRFVSAIPYTQLSLIVPPFSLFLTLFVQYGPTIHHLNAALSKVVDLYKSSLELEFLGTDCPYLFAQGSYSRGVSSQQWTDQHKKAFHRITGLSPCPKTMRQSFICHLRSDTDVDKELMESAAKAMSKLSHAPPRAL